MKILNIEIPDEIVSPTMKQTDWRVDDFELDRSWIGGRISQINPVMAQMIQSESEPDLRKRDQFFVQYIEQLIDDYNEALLHTRREMKLDLLGSLRTLHTIRCRLVSADGPRTLAFLDVLKDMTYDVFIGHFHPDEWDRVSKKYNEALARVISSEDLQIIEYALRLAIRDAHATSCQTRHLKESQVEIERRDADYEHILAVYRRFTGINLLIEEADHVQGDSSSAKG